MNGRGFMGKGGRGQGFDAGRGRGACLRASTRIGEQYANDREADEGGVDLIPAGGETPVRPGRRLGGGRRLRRRDGTCSR
jgi:hypothetical protein